MSRSTLDSAMCLKISCKGLSPSMAGFPKTIRLSLVNHVYRPQPRFSIADPVWPVTRSFATTEVIEFSFSSCRYLDVSVHGVSPRMTMHSSYDDWAFPSRVSPFGYPRLYDCVRLPVAFRSFLRPSSAPGAKAFSHCSWSLDHIALEKPV